MDGASGVGPSEPASGTVAPLVRPAKFLVIVTGHPGAGKTTLAPALAERLDAVCFSREEISNLLFDGWEPEHPALRLDPYVAPTVGGNAFVEGKVSWSIFLATITRACRVAPVVAESPFNDERVRQRFHTWRAQLDVPIAEVCLEASSETLRRRIVERGARPGAHPIKQRFTLAPAESLLRHDFVPVLPPERVVRQDTDDFERLDVDVLAARLTEVLGR